MSLRNCAAFLQGRRAESNQRRDEHHATSSTRSTSLHIVMET